MKTIFTLCYLISIIIFLPLSATADWINLTGAQSAPTIAEIHVEDGHVRLVLEIYVNDLVQNSATECWETPGKICLQSEGGKLDFTNITLVPILREPPKK